jgi:hypothetical protein
MTMRPRRSVFSHLGPKQVFTFRILCQRSNSNAHPGFEPPLLVSGLLTGCARKGGCSFGMGAIRFTADLEATARIRFRVTPPMRFRFP